MKIQDIITESYLSEFAPGGSEDNGPFAYGMALKEMAKLYAEGHFNFDISGSTSASQNESDAYEIDECAEAFLTKGMEAGREAYMMIDDAVQEEMDSFLADQGFNVDNDIRDEYKKDVERYNNSAAGQAASQAAQSQEDAGMQDYKNNIVVIKSVDPNNQYGVHGSIEFDQRHIAPGELQSKIKQSIDKVKQQVSQRYPNDVIQVTIGGKPVSQA
jgi:hypothetical protein